MAVEFAAPLRRVWQAYADPRQLEKIWGRPSHPAAFVDHELSPCARARRPARGVTSAPLRGWGNH